MLWIPSFEPLGEQKAFPEKVHKMITEVLYWLVGCFGFNGPLRQYFSLYRAVSQREGEEAE